MNESIAFSQKVDRSEIDADIYGGGVYNGLHVKLAPDYVVISDQVVEAIQLRRCACPGGVAFVANYTCGPFVGFVPKNTFSGVVLVSKVVTATGCRR